MSQADRDKWNTRYREGTSYARKEPSPYLVSLEDLLPRRGRALDMAGGAGRNALWLARRGLDVSLADISGAAREIARGGADREGLPLRTLAIALEAGRLPPGPWDLILCVDFLWRPLFEALPVELAPCGMLVVS